VRKGIQVKLPASGCLPSSFHPTWPGRGKERDTAQEAGEGPGLVEHTAGGGDQLVQLILEAWWYLRRAVFRETETAYRHQLQ